MQLAILSLAPKCYSTKRLVQAAEERDHDVSVLHTLRFALNLERNAPGLVYDDVQLPLPDAVLPRIGSSITYFGTAVVRQFEQMGVACLNGSEAIGLAKDKLKSMQLLSKHDIGIPKTTFVRGRRDVDGAIERVGGAPLVVKLVEGTQGVGVVLAPNRMTAVSIIDLLLSQKQRILIQNFVSRSAGTDVRAVVVGSQVVASMRRRSEGGEFRSNLHRGAVAEPIELPDDYRTTAIRAAETLGLRFAGVDMVEGEDGPKVLEVNSSPGLEGIESCTGVDVAGRAVDYIAERVDGSSLSRPEC